MLLEQWRRTIDPRAWHSSERQWMESFGASTLVHLSLIALVGLWWTSSPLRQQDAVIQSAWSDEPAVLDSVERELMDQDEDVSGGSITGNVSLSFDTPLAAETLEHSQQTLPISLEGVAPSVDQLNEALSGVPSATGSGSPGTGVGESGQGGEGAGFFGSRSAGTRFVFVVDCSRSMNHIYYGEQTASRFARVQMELVRSIAKMTDSQQFFIVFFNNDALPMPARTLQSATDPTKEKYLRWVAEMRAHGQPTDPRKALALALSLRPDVIYFLTDGAFNRSVERELQRYRQQRAIIHTFAFGEVDAERTLRMIAENNRGEYHYIP